MINELKSFITWHYLDDKTCNKIFSFLHDLIEVYLMDHLQSDIDKQYQVKQLLKQLDNRQSSYLTRMRIKKHTLKLV